MKKRIRKTGEIVDVISYCTPMGGSRCNSDYVSYIDSNGVEHDKEQGLHYNWDFEDVEEELTKEIDWSERRYEIAKNIFNITANFQELTLSGATRTVNKERAAELAVKYADALIAELKKGGGQ